MSILKTKTMQISITINGVERTYQGDYYELHARDWNDRVRDLLDSVYSEEKIGHEVS